MLNIHAITISEYNVINSIMREYTVNKQVNFF